MSGVSTLIVAFAAVYGYVAIYFGVLHALRPKDRVYLAFALLSGALCIYAVGSALLHDAESLRDAALAVRIKAVGILPCVAFMVDFCDQLRGAHDRRLTWLAYGWAAVGIALTPTGLVVDASEPVGRAPLAILGAADYLAPRLTVAGQVLVSGAWALAVVAVARLGRLSRGDRQVGLIVASLVANLVAGGHDALVTFGWLGSVFVLEHTGILSAFAMSYLLLDRFVAASEQLAARSEALRRSYAELQHTEAELVRTEQLAAVGELSAVIAHEVRNPLAVIRNAASGLRKPTLGADDRGTLLGVLDEEIERLNRLVNDLLAYTRPVAPQRRDVGLEELVRRSIDHARAATPLSEKIVFDVDLGSAPSTFHCDPDLMRQVFVNLVDNAIHAMSTGGTLTVRARAGTGAPATGTLIELTDTGIGMDTLVRSKIGTPFFTTRPTGTGLGLAIVDRIVRAHGGTIDITSRHGAGTTVSVALPDPRVTPVPPGPMRREPSP